MKLASAFAYFFALPLVAAALLSSSIVGILHSMVQSPDEKRTSMQNKPTLASVCTKAAVHIAFTILFLVGLLYFVDSNEDDIRNTLMAAAALGAGIGIGLARLMSDLHEVNKLPSPKDQVNGGADSESL